MSTFADAPKVPAGPSLRGSTAAVPEAVTKNGGSTPELAEDGYPKDMEIPIRYVKGMEGDMVEARRRWIATLKVCASTGAACFGKTTDPRRLMCLSLFSRLVLREFLQAQQGWWVFFFLCGSRCGIGLASSQAARDSSLATSLRVEPGCRDGDTCCVAFFRSALLERKRRGKKGAIDRPKTETNPGRHNSFR